MFDWFDGLSGFFGLGGDTGGLANLNLYDAAPQLNFSTYSAPTYSPNPDRWPTHSDMSEGIYQGAYNTYGGDYNKAFADLTAQRWGGMTPSGNIYDANPNDIALRNAEHGMFAQKFLPEMPGFYAKSIGAGLVPAYTGAKWAVQSLPSGIGGAVNDASQALFGPTGDFLNATPASWEELMWGLRPFWGKN